MIDFFGFLIDLLTLGDPISSLQRISDGDDAERQSSQYDAPEMRRLRWTARVVVLAYLVAVVAPPLLIAAWSRSDVWLLRHHRLVFYAEQHFIALVVLYVAAAWAGFWLLRRTFRRKRREIAQRLPPAA
jgi:hypothetical protein